MKRIAPIAALAAALVVSFNVAHAQTAQMPSQMQPPKTLEDIRKAASELTLKQTLVVGAGVVGGLVVGQVIVATGICVAAAGVAGGYLANAFYAEDVAAKPVAPTKTRGSAI